eukprot:1212572-Pyramimonas_sp.AAC.1
MMMMMVMMRGKRRRIMAIRRVKGLLNASRRLLGCLSGAFRSFSCDQVRCVTHFRCASEQDRRLEAQ